MSFCITRVTREGVPVIRLEGHFAGREAWKVLCQHIASAVAEGGRVIVDVAAMTGHDDACLAAIDAGVGTWLSVEGGGEYLRRSLTQDPTE